MFINRCQEWVTSSATPSEWACRYAAWPLAGRADHTLPSTSSYAILLVTPRLAVPRAHEAGDGLEAQGPRQRTAGLRLRARFIHGEFIGVSSENKTGSFVCKVAVADATNL
jgi:hypothetical protein